MWNAVKTQIKKKDEFGDIEKGKRTFWFTQLWFTSYLFSGTVCVPVG